MLKKHNTNSNLKSYSKNILKYLKKNYCWSKQYTRSLNTYLNLLQMSFFHYIRYMILFLNIQLITMSDILQEEKNDIYKNFEIDSDDTIYQNMPIQNEFCIKTDPKVFFDYKNDYNYRIQSEFVNIFCNLFKNEKDEQNFIGYLENLIEIYDGMIIYDNLIDPYAKKFLQNVSIWINNLKAKLFCFQKDNIKKDETDNYLLKDLKNLIKKIHIDYEKIKKNAELSNNSFFHVFHNIIKNERNNFDIMNSVDYYDFLHLLGRISPFYAFFTLSYIFVCLKIITENEYYVTKKNENEVVALNANFNQMFSKINIFYKIYSRKDFICEIENYNKFFSLYDNIYSLNKKIKEETEYAIESHIIPKIRFHHFILIFLCFASNYIDRMKWKIFNLLNLEIFNTNNLKIFKENLEDDLKKMLGLQLEIKEDFNEQSLCKEKYQKFHVSLETTTFKMTQLPLVFLVFLFTSNNGFIRKKNKQQQKCYALVKNLLNFLEKNSVVLHEKDNECIQKVQNFSFLVIYTIEWLSLFIRSNIDICVTNDECKTVYPGFFHYQIYEIFSYRYIKYSLEGFIDLVNRFESEKIKKTAESFFNYICLYFVRHYFEDKNNKTILQNIETLRNHIKAYHPNLWQSSMDIN